MKFQLISMDEYKSTSIQGTFGDIASAVPMARDSVTDSNVRNALTNEERKRFWESYFVVFLNEKNAIDDSLVYAGFLPDGKVQKAYHKNENGISLVEISDDANIRIYLGDLENGSPWYLQNHKNDFITSLDHEDLVGKTVYFIQAVK